MVDFQTLTLFSLTLLTAAMFIFYYLLVIKNRRTPHVTRKIPRTPRAQSSTSISRTKTEDPTLKPIQIPSQAPVQIKAPIDIPIQSQSQISSQTPVQVVSQIPVRAPPENALNLPAKAPILRGEAATEALKEFAEELEKGEDTSVEKTRDASLIKLARVLIDVIQTEKGPEKTPKTPDQNKPEVEHERKTTTKPSRKDDHLHEHSHSGKKKKTKMHQPSRTGKANRKTKNETTKVKSREHGRPTKKHSGARFLPRKPHDKSASTTHKHNPSPTNKALV
jgi:hypothetical protein